MNKSKWVVLGLAVTVLSGTIVGCGNDKAVVSDKGTSTEKQELNLTLGDEIPSLDPSKGTDSISFTIMGQINEGLIRLDEKGQPTAGVAKEWKVSADGKTYTFTLRDDAKWSDGSAVTAQDFEYSWKRSLDPNTKSSYAFMLAWIAGGDAYNTGKGTADEVKVKAKDDKTLEVQLESAKPYFLEQLAFPVFFPEKKAFVEKVGDKFGGDVDKVLSNGPFKITQWSHEQSVEIVKNDTYWDKGNVKLDKVTFQVVKDPGARENLFEAGQIDRFGLLADQVDRYKDKPEFKRRNDLYTGYLEYNSARPALANAKIRQALTFAIDGDKYTDIVFHDGSVGATGFVPTGISDGTGDFREHNGDVMKTKENAAKAKTLLAEGLKEAGLTEFPKLKLASSDSASGKKGVEFIKEQWRSNLGIDIEVELMPFKLRLQKQRSKDYDISITNWGADYNDPMTFLDLFVTDGGFNDVSYKNPKYDALIKSAQVEPDAKKRMQMLYDAEKMFMADMPVGPVYFSASTSISKPYIKNWVNRVTGPDMDLKTTYIQGKE
ncbi:peptide ABC transporter substrate-binding protein [Tumebacillus permanentifrigoris]|uniref:Oligopeptide transport system substrate-binding protein n=1 Tax=Tumebacillus permanentifrigoris TaxID=378543 RepID=A0A316D5W4_9BACL|nr:peptide ABC transporter substrate-binding protein [Tumebacillus permanentifrigoris]PWK05991.1 oligopeptide transport system substrate-binding protein [Tumebacillus permanentifrigoris]